MPRRTYRQMAMEQTFERVAMQRAGNRLQAPTMDTMRRMAYNRKRRKSNGGNGG